MVVNMAIDLDALHQSASRTDRRNVVVSRTWLLQVERELREGRAAQAQLQAGRCMDDVVNAIANGASR